MKKFCDLLWVVETIDNYENIYQCHITRSHLVNIIENSFLGGRRTKSVETLFDLLVNLKLLGFNKKSQVYLMGRGRKLLKKKKVGVYELDQRQKRLLALWYISFSEEKFKIWLKFFSEDNDGTLQVSRSQILLAFQQWTEEMIYFEIAKQCKDELTLTEKYIWISSKIKDKKIMTLKELKKKLENQEISGRNAEEFVVDFEKKRLESEGLFTEANLVTSISEEIANAGYDILSFSGPSLTPNRFIEVKSVSEDLNFYLSHNELEISRKIGEEYFIYLVNQKNKDKIYLDIIKNPYNIIRNKCILTPTQYKVSFHKGVEKDARGSGIITSSFIDKKDR